MNQARDTQPEPRPHTRTERLAVVVITVALAAVFIVLVAPRYLFGGDPDHYVGLARSLAGGEGYVINGHPETKFPPGYPVILAPAAQLFGGSFLAIARWAALLAALAFPAAYFMLRRRGEPFAVLLALASVASVPFVIVATGNPMSEPFFIVCAMLLIAWADDWERDSRRSWSSLFAGAGLVFAVVATRMVGAAAVSAAALIVIWRLVTRRFTIRDLLPLAAGVAFLASWLAWTSAHTRPSATAGPESGYVRLLLLADPEQPDLGRASVAQIATRIATNAVKQAAHAGELLTQIPWLKPTWYSPVALLIALVVAGWWRHLRSGGAFGALYFASYLAIMLVWPFDEGGRFLVPLAPLLLLYAVQGVRLVSQSLVEEKKDVRRAGIVMSAVALAGALAWPWVTGAARSTQDVMSIAVWIAVLAALLAGYRWVIAAAAAVKKLDMRIIGTAALLTYVAAGALVAGPTVWAFREGRLPPLSTESALEKASVWISANAPAESVIQSTWPERVNFATGRRGVLLPVTASRDVLRQSAEREGANFVVVLADPPFPYVAPSDSIRFHILQTVFPDRWVLAADLGRARVYALRPGGSTSVR